MTSSITVVPRTHWVNGWFLRAFSRPIVLVNGTEHAARWGHPLEVAVSAGTHRVGVGARYRGAAGTLGVEESRIDVANGANLRAEARNGFFNHQPFTLTEPELIKAAPTR